MFELKLNLDEKNDAKNQWNVLHCNLIIKEKGKKRIIWHALCLIMFIYYTSNVLLIGNACFCTIIKNSRMICVCFFAVFIGWKG